MPATHHRADSRAQPRVSPRLLAELASRVTARDHQLLDLLLEHRVLTTIQITRLVFGSRQACNRRLLLLHRHTVLARFRPWRATGSAPWHWILGPAGAHVLAAARSQTVTELGWRADHTLAIAHSPALAHLIGVNDVMSRLAAHARSHPEAELRRWWSEQRCATHWGDHAHPDAYGRWHHDDATVDFFLEYDTGSESLARVASKLDGYARLSAATGIATPVCFALPSSRREHNLHQAITTHGAQPPVTVATTSGRYLAEHGGPAGSVWLPHTGQETATRRVRLTELASPLGEAR